MAEKAAFTPDQKRQRLAYVKENKDRPLTHWQSTIFADEHVCHRRPGHLPGVHIAGQRRRFPTINDRRRRQRPWNHPKLHFLYGVHWKLGVLGPYWVHDCTGWKRARKWQASGGTHLVPAGQGDGAPFT